MKGYAITLALITVLGFSAIGLIIYQAVPHDSKIVPFILNTNSMVEAGSTPGHSTMGPAVVAYYSGKSEAVNNFIPQADVFVCISPNKLDSTKTDTVLLLDTRLHYETGDLVDVNKYEAGVKPAKKLTECSILIPENEVKKFRTYKYKYAVVQLVTDD